MGSSAKKAKKVDFTRKTSFIKKATFFKEWGGINTQFNYKGNCTSKKTPPYVTNLLLMIIFLFN